MLVYQHTALTHGLTLGVSRVPSWAAGQEEKVFGAQASTGAQVTETAELKITVTQ